MARKSKKPASGAFRLSQSSSHLLHRAEQFAADRFAQLANDSVTLRQFAVLAAIAEQPGLSQSDLVRATGIDRSTLADMMNRLAKRGLVARSASSSDARAYAVRLSTAGSALLNTTASHARAADAAVLELLPRAQRKGFLKTLAQLAELAAEAGDEPAPTGRRQAKRRTPKRAKKKRAPARRVKSALTRPQQVRRERV